MLTPLRGLAIISGLVALGFAVEAPALADTYRHVDARHDVERFPQEDRATHNRNADITSLRIVHNTASLRFFVRFRSGSMKGVDFRTFGVALRTPHDDYTASFIWNYGGEQQDDLLDQTTGRSISCDQSINRRDRTYVLRINRACIGKPRRVRAALGSGVHHPDNEGLSDTALSNAWRESPATDELYSPRVQSSA